MRSEQSEISGPVDAVVNRPAGQDGVKQLALAVILIAICSYGLCRVLEVAGMIVWYADGSSHFWFEQELRAWIHGK